MTIPASTDRPFLITGCGRSGTAWAAQIMTALGHPCGHERQFGVAYRPASGTLPASDSSWLAMPYLASLPSGTRIIRMMRDPNAVVASAVERGFLRNLDDPYSAFAIRHCPIIAGAQDWLGRAIRWAAYWDAPMVGIPHRTVYLETPYVPHMLWDTVRRTATPVEVADAMSVVGHPNANDTTSNSLFPRPSVADLYEHPDAHLLIDRAERYGYR